MGWKQQINQHKVQLPKELEGRGNGQLPKDVLVDVFNGNGKRIGRLNRPAATAWAAMVAAAKADGIILDATDTYRDLAIQQRLWDERYDHTDHGNGGRTCGGEHRFLKKGMATSACPGTSNHGWGNAVDDKNQTPKDGLTWLEENAARFGWEWELPSEVWHLHYFAGDDPPPAVLEGMDDMYDAKARDELVTRLDAIKGGIDEIFKKAIQEEAIIKKLEAAIDGLDDSGGLTKDDVKAAVTEALANQ